MAVSARRAATRAYHRGGLVTVKSLGEILATLDSSGTIEGLPFMPEMAKFCGRIMRVAGRIEHVYLDHYMYVARLYDTVALEDARCDGRAHAGCGMGCQILWKHAWLKPASPEAEASEAAAERRAAASGANGCMPRLPIEQDGRFVCQATELVRATTRLPWWDVRQYVRGLLARDLKFLELLRIVAVGACNKLRARCGVGPLGMVRGRQHRTAAERLDLQPGEWVEVKGRTEIAATLDVHGKNRGLAFVPEMGLYCGQRFRVKARVPRMIIEGTAELRELASTVVLDEVCCRGIAQRGCPRACFHLWREAWLRRVSNQPCATDSPARADAPPELPCQSFVETAEAPCCSR